MKTIWLCAIALGFFTPFTPQTHKASPAESPIPPTMQWESLTSRLFSNDPRKATFSLSTSWIPGQDHQGLLRYKLVVIALDVTNDERGGYPLAQTGPNFLKRVANCGVQLTFEDGEGFLVRKFAVPLTRVSDDYAQVAQLISNSLTQMDLAEYRMILGSDKIPGGWKVAVGCN